MYFFINYSIKFKGDMMQEFIIGEYIKKMTVKDVLDYAQKRNILLDECDATILLIYAKKYYHEFISGNPKEIIKELKDKLSPDTFKGAYKLYLEAKIKYLK